jgi:hypothetical protein
VGLAFDGLDVFADRCIFFGFATRRLPESAGRLARALLLATLLAFAGPFVFADLLNLSLLTGVQLWRVQWLGHWVAIASLPYLLQFEFKSGGLRNVSLCC